jgi:hypothetical protein
MAAVRIRTYVSRMSFRIEHVAIGENRPPPFSERRVLLSTTVKTVVEDEWGAIIPYQAGSETSLFNAKLRAAEWRDLQGFPVENMYIESAPDAQGT